MSIEEIRSTIAKLKEQSPGGFFRVPKLLQGEILQALEVS